MRRYRVVQGEKGQVLFEANRFSDASKAKIFFDSIKMDIKNLNGHGCLQTQIKCYYDDERGGYLEKEEIIANYEYYY